MSAASESGTIQGRCLCGSVTLHTAPGTPHVDACHCTMCRQWGGAPFISLPADKELRIEGQEHLTRYRSSDWAERGFCSKCGTHLFYFFRPEASYSCPAGLFPGADAYTMRSEIFVDEKPAYYDFAGERRRLTGAEAIAEMTGEG